MFERLDIAGCEPYSDVIREWCDAGDQFCDRGNVTTVHTGYFARYVGVATDFIVEQFHASMEAPPAPQPTATVLATNGGVARGFSSAALPVAPLVLGLVAL